MHPSIARDGGALPTRWRRWRRPSSASAARCWAENCFTSGECAAGRAAGLAGAGYSTAAAAAAQAGHRPHTTSWAWSGTNPVAAARASASSGAATPVEVGHRAALPAHRVGVRLDPRVEHHGAVAGAHAPHSPSPSSSSSVEYTVGQRRPGQYVRDTARAPARRSYAVTALHSARWITIRCGVTRSPRSRSWPIRRSSISETRPFRYIIAGLGHPYSNSLAIVTQAMSQDIATPPRTRPRRTRVSGSTLSSSGSPTRSPP